MTQMNAQVVNYNSRVRKLFLILLFALSFTAFASDYKRCSSIEIIQSIDRQMTESLVDMVAMYSSIDRNPIEKLSSGSIYGLFDYRISNHEDYEYSGLFQINELSVCEETGAVANGTFEIRNNVNSQVSDITVIGKIDLKNANDCNNIYFRYSTEEKTVRINNTRSTYDLEEYLKIMTQKYLQIMNRPVKGG